MSADRDVNRIVRSWLNEDRHEDADRVLNTVLDQLDTTPQRRSWWSAWRFPIMNNALRVGLVAAAVVIIAVIAINLLPGSPMPGGAPSVSPSVEPSAEPSTTSWTGLPQGPFVISDDEMRITVNIASSGWESLPEFEAVSKDDDGLDSPESVGVALLAWAWPAGTGFNVYGDPCQWLTTIPETPATTPDEIAADLAAQASTDATAPVDVTVGGYVGKAITLQVPMALYVPGATREETFADCDENVFAFYGLEADESLVERNAQGAGQIDELWILDVDGSIVILDATYGPAAPADLVEELRALAESASFD